MQPPPPTPLPESTKAPVDAGAERARRVVLDRVVRIGLVLAGLAVVVWCVWYFATLIVYLLVGSILAYLLRPLVDRVQGLGLGRIPAILVTLVLVIGTVSVLLTYLVPFVAQQTGELSQQVSVEALTAAASDIERWLARWLPVQPGQIEQAVTDAVTALFQSERITQVVGSMVDLFADIFYAVLVIPFVIFFVLKDGTLIRRGMLGLVPNRYFEVTLALTEQIETTIGRYFRGLLLQCVSIAALASVALYVVGLQYALAVGLFAGLANTIPYFGPLMGLLAGTLVGVAQTGDFSLVPGVLAAMAVTQVADNVFFQPLIFARAAEAHPLLILFVVLVGAQLAGIVGMLLAIPCLTIVRVTAQQILWSLRNYRILHVAS